MNRQAGKQYKEVALHKVCDTDGKVHGIFQATGVECVHKRLGKFSSLAFIANDFITQREILAF